MLDDVGAHAGTFWCKAGEDHLSSGTRSMHAKENIHTAMLCSLLSTFVDIANEMIN